MRERARSTPLASVMRLMNSSRITAFTGSMFSLPNSGMTFSVKATFCPLPAKASRSSSPADLFPATMMLRMRADVASREALWRMVRLLPPSVPPVRSTMSGERSSSSRSSLFVIS